MRFGNDEVKPNDMNEDTKEKYDKSDPRAESDHQDYNTACKDERNLLYDCLADNKSNIR